jgi:hypothetical protein
MIIQLLCLLIATWYAHIDGNLLSPEVSTRKDLRLPTVMPSDVCIISVLNLSGAAVNFAAALRGMKVSR